MVDYGTMVNSTSSMSYSYLPWIVIYIVIAIIVYAIIYYLWKRRKGGY